MDLLAELNKLKADFAAYSELLETANSQLAEKDNSIQSVNELLSVANMEIEAKAGKVTELEAVIANHAAEVETLKQTIADLEANKQTAEQKAIELVAEQGVKPVKVDVQASNAPSKEDLLKEFSAITNNIKRAEFWQKHKAALLSK